MRNELEQLIVKHGSFWIVSLVAVAISKMYSREKQTFRTVARSLLASVAISFIVVEHLASKETTSTIFIYVFVSSMLSDVIVESVMGLGRKIKDDPSFLAKFLPWGGKK